MVLTTIVYRYENQQLYLEDVEAKIATLTQELRKAEEKALKLRSEIPVEVGAGTGKRSPKAADAAAALGSEGTQTKPEATQSEKDIIDVSYGPAAESAIVVMIVLV